MSDFGKLFNIFDMIEKIGDGFAEILDGMGYTIEHGVTGAYHGFLDVMEFAQYLAVFLFTNGVCMIKNISNMTSCIMYYIWDAFLQLCYLPIRITLYLLHFLLPRVYEWEASFWNFMEQIDQLWVKYFRFHLIHYPKAVRDKCYNCKRLKTTVFAGKMMGYADDAVEISMDVMNGPVKIVRGLSDVLMAVISF